MNFDHSDIMRNFLSIFITILFLIFALSIVYFGYKADYYQNTLTAEEEAKIEDAVSQNYILYVEGNVVELNYFKDNITKYEDIVINHKKKTISLIGRKSSNNFGTGFLVGYILGK